MGVCWIVVGVVRGKKGVVCEGLVIFGGINWNFMVSYFDGCEIVEMVCEGCVKVFVEGGWGVDGVIGRERRIDKEMDVLVEKKEYGKGIWVIRWKG